jgi:hypothetical protein
MLNKTGEKGKRKEKKRRKYLKNKTNIFFL